jgi:hypothetical protein
LQHSHRNGDVDESLRDCIKRAHGVGHKKRVYHSLSVIQDGARTGRRSLC